MVCVALVELSRDSVVEDVLICSWLVEARNGARASQTIVLRIVLELA